MQKAGQQRASSVFGNKHTTIETRHKIRNATTSKTDYRGFRGGEQNLIDCTKTRVRNAKDYLAKLNKRCPKRRAWFSVPCMQWVHTARRQLIQKKELKPTGTLEVSSVSKPISRGTIHTCSKKVPDVHPSSMIITEVSEDRIGA